MTICMDKMIIEDVTQSVNESVWFYIYRWYDDRKGNRLVKEDVWFYMYARYDNRKLIRLLQEEIWFYMYEQYDNRRRNTISKRWYNTLPICRITDHMNTPIKLIPQYLQISQKQKPPIIFYVISNALCFGWVK